VGQAREPAGRHVGSSAILSGAKGERREVLRCALDDIPSRDVRRRSNGVADIGDSHLSASRRIICRAAMTMKVAHSQKHRVAVHGGQHGFIVFTDGLPVLRYAMRREAMRFAALLRRSLRRSQ
jgi:hypothetical protein